VRAALHVQERGEDGTSSKVVLQLDELFGEADQADKCRLEIGRLRVGDAGEAKVTDLFIFNFN